MNELKGKICPYCGKKFKKKDNAVFCSACLTPQHYACMKAAGHCTAPACKGALYIADEKNEVRTQIITEAGNKPAARKNRKPEKHTVIAASIIFVLLLAAGFGCTAVFYIMPSARYSSAQKTLESGSYDAAYEMFDALGGFKDAEDMAKEALYLKAAGYKKEKKYKAAVSVYEGIRDYKDSADLEKFCTAELLFEKGIAAYDNKSFSDSASYFDQITNAKDEVREWAKKAHYAYAEEMAEKLEFDTAAEHYEAAGDYADAADRAKDANYIFGMQCYAKKYYRQAYNYLSKVKDYLDVPELYEEVTYQYGNWLVKHGSDDLALNIFLSLGNYKKSIEHINEIKYNYAAAHMDSSNSKTYRYLKQLKSETYEDSGLLYEQLFSWKLSLVAVNTKKDDFNTIYSEIGRKSKYVHFEFLLSDGPVDSTVDLSYTVEFPDGSESLGTFTWEKLKSGETFGLVFPDGLYENGSGKTGDLKIKIYNNDTSSLLGEFTVKIAKSSAQ